MAETPELGVGLFLSQRRHITITWTQPRRNARSLNVMRVSKVSSVRARSIGMRVFRAWRVDLLTRASSAKGLA